MPNKTFMAQLKIMPQKTIRQMGKKDYWTDDEECDICHRHEWQFKQQHIKGYMDSDVQSCLLGYTAV
jgi:hypothetical protein